ncbi:unnamed protein product [Dibothriocephalus latus]|uniref:UBX domain-containing protein n=1 Tax=Dibothriocephalus latus TaxID=60516 RepID=A0A3P7MJF8_DIBLA|nr:unnamed protein product [Dibothriocephalus latus]
MEAPVSPGFTILDLTEEEQLQMALRASAAETAGCSTSASASDPVNTPSTSASATNVHSSTRPLPKPSNPAHALRIALRLPSGTREVLELDPNMRLRVSLLFSCFLRLQPCQNVV